MTAADSADLGTDELILRARRGDRDALGQLVLAFQADMSRVAIVICGDPEVAADAVQNAWLRVVNHIGSLRDPDRLRPWLCAIAANESRQIVRRRQPRAVSGDSESSDRSSVDDSVLDLRNALTTFDPSDRELLALRYVAGFSAPELAEHFRLTPEGIRSRTKRLLDRLRTELDR